MLPRFEIVARHRPIDLIAPARRREVPQPPPGTPVPVPVVAPYLAVVVDLADEPGKVTVALSGLGVPVAGWYDPERGRLGLTVAGQEIRSRRHGRPEGPVTAVALSLTGEHLAVWAYDGSQWTAHARTGLDGVVDPRDPTVLRGLEACCDAPVARLSWGPFGQLGLRDLHVATHATGEPVRDCAGRIVFTATHAGPGFFDTGRTGVWALDPATLDIQHLSDLYFERPDLPGVYGDHATHLVRDDDQWLVLTSTWGDFDRTRVEITLARSEADLLVGEHVLPTERLVVPSDGVGVWDPHLARIDAVWHLAYVWASSFFVFGPGLARGPLEALEPVGEDRGKRATEGTVLVPIDGEWRLLASDGRDNRPGVRMRYPIYDLALQEVGTVEAPYLTNIPWPMVVRDGDDWLMLAFNGSKAGGDLLGYGTHGEVVLLRGRR